MSPQVTTGPYAYLVGKRLYLNPERSMGWRVTSVNGHKVSVVSLTTGVRTFELFADVRAAISEGYIYVTA